MGGVVRTGFRDWFTRLYIWATYRLYNEFAWAYDWVSWLVSLGGWSSWRRLALDYADSGSILEVGFGTGELLLEMKSRGWEVIGLERSSAMLRVAQRKMKRQSRWVPCLQSITQALPFASSNLDTILSTFPASFIFDERSLNEFQRVLRSVKPGFSGGGRVVIVGMYVQVKPRWMARIFLPIYGNTDNGLLARFEEMTRAAGFHTRLVYHERRFVRVPVIILEKLA